MSTITSPREKYKSLYNQFSFEAFIDDEDARFSFRAFLEQSKNLEPLLFIEEVELFILLKSEANRYKTAKQIIEDFAQTTSKYELNITQSARSRLLQRFEACSESSCPKNLFDEVYNLMLFELKQDCFPRFVKSGEFEEFVQKKEKKNDQYLNKLLKSTTPPSMPSPLNSAASSVASSTTTSPILIPTSVQSDTVSPFSSPRTRLSSSAPHLSFFSSPSSSFVGSSTMATQRPSDDSSSSSSKEQEQEPEMMHEMDNDSTERDAETEHQQRESAVELLQELFFAFSRPYTGITIKDRKKGLFKTYGNCFSGSEACTWICSYLKIEREDAVGIGLKFIQNDWVTNANYRKRCAGRFIDSDKHFYRFVKKKKVVIVGGGFGGCTAAKSLQYDFDVTLVDTKPTFEYILDFPQLLSDPSQINKIVTPYSDIVKRGTIINAQVKSVSPDGVYIEEKGGMQRYVPFDYMIVSTGCRYVMPFPVDEESQSICMYPYSSSSILGQFARLREAKKVVVIGGGALGLEIVGEICAAYKNTNVYLISQRNVLLERQCAAVHRRAIRLLSHYHNLKLLLSRKVVGINKKVVSYKYVVDEMDAEAESVSSSSSSSSSSEILNEEYTLDADLIIICGGVEARTEIMSRTMSYALNNNKQIIVNDRMQVRQPANYVPETRLSQRLSSVGNMVELMNTQSKSTGAIEDVRGTFFKNIFAIGDCTCVQEEKLAQNAMLHASVVANNIKAIDKGKTEKTLSSYKPADRIQIISVGPQQAVMIRGNQVLSDGAIFAKIKGLVKMKVMLGIK